MEIAQQEVSRCTVFTARISRTFSGSRGEYVLHLFDHDGDRSTNLSLRYGGMAGVRYSGWRGETCTIRDLYEKMCMNKHEIGMK
jgi:hypothetical protein